MPRKPSSTPTDVELAILRVLWEGEPRTVREVHNALQATRDTEYSTTLKMMQVMLGKGLLRRDESSRPQTYRPAISRQRMQKRLVENLIDKAFGGAASRLMVSALSSRRVTPGELEEIKQLIRRLEEGES